MLNKREERRGEGGRRNGERRVGLRTAKEVSVTLDLGLEIRSSVHMDGPD